MTQTIEPVETWTIETVKRDLPDMQILMEDGVTVKRAILTGRRNPMAKVFAGGRNQDYEFSWVTITNALNAGRSLRL